MKGIKTSKEDMTSDLFHHKWPAAMAVCSCQILAFLTPSWMSKHEFSANRDGDDDELTEIKDLDNQRSTSEKKE